jgi:septum formation protein
MLKNRNFVLASSSPRRRALLAGVGLDFEVIPPRVRESAHEGEGPLDFAKRMAREKALSVCAQERPGRIVVGSDTVVSISGQIFGKPRDEEDALLMLQKLSGRTHEVITGFCVARSPGDVLHLGATRTEVRMKSLDTEGMRRYIKTGEPMDKAGAYAIQGIGSCLVEWIKGSYTGVVGLPLFELVSVLSDIGVVESE